MEVFGKKKFTKRSSIWSRKRMGRYGVKGSFVDSLFLFVGFLRRKGWIHRLKSSLVIKVWPGTFFHFFHPLRFIKTCLPTCRWLHGAYPCLSFCQIFCYLICFAFTKQIGTAWIVFRHTQNFGHNSPLIRLSHPSYRKPQSEHARKKTISNLCEC